MKIFSLQIFNENPKPIQNNSVKQPNLQYSQVNKEINLNKMPNANSFIMNFKGNEYIEKYIGSKEIRIDDITAIEEDLHIGLNDMPNGKKHLNATGLNVNKKVGIENTQFTISNDDKKILFIATVKNGTELPILTYKQGKFMPEITVKHSSLGNARAKMLAGSEIIAEDFSLVMPGAVHEPNGDIKRIQVNNGIAFKGSIAISTLNLEKRTQNAVDLYMNSDLPHKMTKGEYIDDIHKYDPFVAIPAGGFGERIYNLTRENENKPSYLLPTANECRIIGTTLNMASSAELIKGDGNDKITYLSQTHDINDGNVVHTNKYEADGGAIAEGIERGIISKNKDLIILNADIFTNADITRPYHALKTLPEAALIIPYYPVDAERAKSFGLLAYDVDENGNTQIKDFVEKSKYLTEPPQPNEFSSDKDYNDAMNKYIAAQKAKDSETKMFYSNPGMYFMSKEAVNILKEMKNKAGLGADVMPEIVELCNEGKLLNDEGKPMKAYMVPLERADGKAAFWDDIGTAEAYLKVIKDVAHETKAKGTGVENKFYGVPEFILNDFNNNVDSETNVVYQSQEARSKFENFKNEMNITDARGNIFVVE